MKTTHDLINWIVKHWEAIASSRENCFCDKFGNVLLSKPVFDELLSRDSECIKQLPDAFALEHMLAWIASRVANSWNWGPPRGEPLFNCLRETLSSLCAYAKMQLSEKLYGNSYKAFMKMINAKNMRLEENKEELAEEYAPVLTVKDAWDFLKITGSTVTDKVDHEILECDVKSLMDYNTQEAVYAIIRACETMWQINRHSKSQGKQRLVICAELFLRKSLYTDNERLFHVFSRSDSKSKIDMDDACTAFVGLFDLTPESKKAGIVNLKEIVGRYLDTVEKSKSDYLKSISNELVLSTHVKALMNCFYNSLSERLGRETFGEGIGGSVNPTGLKAATKALAELKSLSLRAFNISSRKEDLLKNLEKLWVFTTIEEEYIKSSGLPALQFWLKHVYDAVNIHDNNTEFVSLATAILKLVEEHCPRFDALKDVPCTAQQASSILARLVYNPDIPGEAAQMECDEGFMEGILLGPKGAAVGQFLMDVKAAEQVRQLVNTFSDMNEKKESFVQNLETSFPGVVADLSVDAPDSDDDNEPIRVWKTERRNMEDSDKEDGEYVTGTNKHNRADSTGRRLKKKATIRRVN